MKFVAFATEDNDYFSVKLGQSLCSIDLDESIYLDPETGEMMDGILDQYFLKGYYGTPERSIAELCEIEWVRVEDFPEIFPPIIPTE